MCQIINPWQNLESKKTYHLLERETLRLRNNEPDKGGAQGGDETKEDVGAVGDVGEQVGGDLANDEVVPITCKLKISNV